MLNNLLLGQTAEEKLYVEDVFSSYLYRGTGGDSSVTNTITNDIDLAGKGGLVWIKTREAAISHALYDTARGVKKILGTDSTAAEAVQGSVYGLTSFNSNGFTLTGNWASRENADTPYASWTFRKAPKFFDIVTYVGNGTSQSIPHNLGSVPGMIVVKKTSTAGSWSVYHRSIGAGQTLSLSETLAAGATTTFWNNTTPTATVFSLGANSTTNQNGVSYVAYLFAHDTTADGIVQCGSFSTDASGNATVSLGFEPQFVLFKASSTTGSWRMYDNMRGIATGGNDAVLYANLTSAEDTASNAIDLSATGFSVSGQTASATFIYLAIRRGPMRTPTDATKVFHASTASGVITTGFPVDLNMIGFRTGNAANAATRTRLIGGAPYIVTSSTAAETGTTDIGFTSNTGLTYSMSTDWINWNFRRAPGFFDVLNSKQSGTLYHNLQVAPEIIILKARDYSPGQDWFVIVPSLGSNGLLYLNTNAAATSTGVVSSITASSFYTAAGGGSYNYIYYLFASCPGVSKVGSYTGNGSSQNIDCGFTNGARFVLIKRTDNTGDWYVWDTARGIVSANDPHLSLNSSAAEVTTNDSIDPLSTGFTVNQVSATNVNVSSATYIYLAIA